MVVSAVTSKPLSRFLYLLAFPLEVASHEITNAGKFPQASENISASPLGDSDLQAGVACNSVERCPRSHPRRLASANHKHDLLERLLEADNYNPLVPPFEGKPHTILMEINLFKINVDIIAGTVDLRLWLRLAWWDQRLNFHGSYEFPRWLPNDYLASPVFRLWHPDIQVVSSVAEQDFTEQQAYIFDDSHWNISEDAKYKYNVKYSRPGSVAYQCDSDSLDIRNFPFDRPVCSMNFGSWAYGPADVQLVLPPNPIQIEGILFPKEQTDVTTTSVGGGSFYLVEASLEAHMKSYTFVDNDWQEVVLRTRLRRKHESYITNVVGPLTMMVVLANLVFWLPISSAESGSGERMGFAVTLFLTIIAICIFTHELRPPVSDSVWLDRYQIVCTILTMIPIIETAFVFYFSGVHGAAQRYQQHMEDCVLDLASELPKTHTKVSFEEVLLYTKFRKVLHRIANGLGVHKAWRVELSVANINSLCRHLFPIGSFFAIHPLFQEIHPDFWNGDDWLSRQLGGWASIINANSNDRFIGNLIVCVFFLLFLLFVLAIGHFIWRFVRAAVAHAQPNSFRNDETETGEKNGPEADCSRGQKGIEADCSRVLRGRLHLDYNARVPDFSEDLRRCSSDLPPGETNIVEVSNTLNIQIDNGASLPPDTTPQLADGNSGCDVRQVRTLQL